MKTEKKLGIFLDHSQAHFINYHSESEKLETIDSDFTHFEKEKSFSKSENGMHNKEQQELGTFFKKITKVIMDYDDVLLFGPTNAKLELFNHIRLEHKYDKIKIEIKDADKMSENEQVAFVKNHFDLLLNHK